MANGATKTIQGLCSLLSTYVKKKNYKEQTA